jgi:hypothetical protein
MIQKPIAFSSAVKYPTASEYLDTLDHNEIVAMTQCNSARTVLADRRSLRLRDEFTMRDTWHFNTTMADALESALAGGAR